MHAQLGTERTSGFIRLASVDPVVFIVDVIASANDGRLEVPDPMIGALKAELNRIRTAKLEAAEDLAHCVEPHGQHRFPAATGGCGCSPPSWRRRPLDPVTPRW
jgi:hypothetical protein